MKKTHGNRVHGHTSPLTPEYRAWRDMLGRCRNVLHRSYRLYGARGIYVCKRWHSFPRFLADVGLRPSKEYSLERIDNNGHYTPKNVKWASWLEQANNTRHNRPITIAGKTKTLTQWARIYGIKPKTASNRIGIGIDPVIAVTFKHIPIGRPRTPVPVGTKYGRLTVLGFAGLAKDRHSQWLCKCDCGRNAIMVANRVRRGTTKSCGCLSKWDHARTRRSLTK